MVSRSWEIESISDANDLLRNHQRTSLRINAWHAYTNLGFIIVHKQTCTRDDWKNSTSSGTTRIWAPLSPCRYQPDQHHLDRWREKYNWVSRIVENISTSSCGKLEAYLHDDVTNFVTGNTGAQDRAEKVPMRGRFEHEVPRNADFVHKQVHDQILTQWPSGNNDHSMLNTSYRHHMLIFIAQVP